MSQLWREMYGIDDMLALQHAEENEEVDDQEEVLNDDNVILLAMSEDEIEALIDFAESVEHSEDISDLSFDDLFDKAFEHHGILGMKWGVRRFQNKDGSLTAKGKQRYYDATNVGDATKIAAYNRGSVVAGRAAATSGALLTGSLLGSLHDVNSTRKSMNTLFRTDPERWQALTTRYKELRGWALEDKANSLKTMAIATGIVGLLGGAYAIAKYIKNKKEISRNYADPDAVSNMKPGMKKHKAETGSLAKAVDDKNYATVFRNWLYNKKMSKDMKSALSSFDAKLKAAVQKVNDPSTSRKDSNRIKMETAAGMKQYAANILKEMGWKVNDQNIFYLTQVIWKFDGEQLY